MKKPRTYEERSLLISYISTIGIWFAIPIMGLAINRDKRAHFALFILILIIVMLFLAYFMQWKLLFPRTADEQIQY